MKTYTSILISAIFLLSLNGISQIPNFSFENWTTIGSYSVPDNWDNLNSTTAPGSVFTCTKGTPGNPGSSYMKLTSKTVSGVGVVPGIAVSGVLDHSTHLPVSGFPFTGRPEKLTGNWQYMMFGSGKGFIDVSLTRWNTSTHLRETVASKRLVLNGMVMSWASFSITLTYASGSYPDSCQIFLSASGDVAANNDYLWVDNLQFTGDVATGTDPEPRVSHVSVFPNPATNLLHVIYPSTVNSVVTIKVVDMAGKTIIETKSDLLPGDNRIILNTGILQKGVYLLKVDDGKSVSTEKITIQ